MVGKRTNSSVSWDVNGAVDEAVEVAVYQAVDRDVDGAVSDAVYWAVNEAGNRAVCDVEHPTLKDFLREVEA